MTLIADFESRYVLGVADMDETHREFVDLVNRLESASSTTFPALFEELLKHTREHFKSEEALMEQSGFPAIREHKAEHQRVLGELTRFAGKATSGSLAFGRAYVREQLPPWFDLHAKTMDSALAAHLKAYAREDKS